MGGWGRSGARGAAAAQEPGPPLRSTRELMGVVQHGSSRAAAAAAAAIAHCTVASQPQRARRAVAAGVQRAPPRCVHPGHGPRQPLPGHGRRRWAGQGVCTCRHAPAFSNRAAVLARHTRGPPTCSPARAGVGHHAPAGHPGLAAVHGAPAPGLHRPLLGCAGCGGHGGGERRCTLLPCCLALRRALRPPGAPNACARPSAHGL